MATRPLSPRLRCDALESRVTPATILDLGTPDTPGPLLLTDGPFQARAAWAPTPVDVRAFHTSFVFRQDGEPAQKGDGFTFALTGTPDQPAGRAGGGLGYAGLTDSVAIKFDLVDNAGEGVNSVGLYTGGADPAPGRPTGCDADQPAERAPVPGRHRLRRDRPDAHPDRHDCSGPALDPPVPGQRPGRRRVADRVRRVHGRHRARCSPSSRSTRGRSRRTPRRAGRR